jgi:hypothetical protein
MFRSLLFLLPLIALLGEPPAHDEDSDALAGAAASSARVREAGQLSDWGLISMCQQFCCGVAAEARPQKSGWSATGM